MRELRVYSSYSKQLGKCHSLNDVNCVNLQFKREGQNEKEVDGTIISDMSLLGMGKCHQCCNEQCVCSINGYPEDTRIVLFSGDRDMKRAVKYALSHNFVVDLMVIKDTESICYHELQKNF